MKLEEYLQEVVKFLRQQIEKNNAKGLIIGLSGGIDSAVAALLAKQATSNSLCLIMPCFSPDFDLKCAQELVKKHDLNYKIVDLSNTFTSFNNEIKTEINSSKAKLVYGNLKARLRMSCLYAFAQENNYLVVGTDNADEWFTGYFTKYGDGGVDILPLVYLLKKDVFAAAKILGVNEEIINRAPSASLWPDQTDEQEMGFTYNQLDDYLLNHKENLSPEVIKKIETLHKNSNHKRTPLPVPRQWDRS